MVSNISANKDNNKIYEGILSGAAIGLAMPAYTLHESLKPVSVYDAKSTAKYMAKFMPDVDTFESTKNNIETLLKDTGLDKKGVKLFAHDGSKECDNAFSCYAQ